MFTLIDLYPVVYTGQEPIIVVYTVVLQLIVTNLIPAFGRR